MNTPAEDDYQSRWLSVYLLFRAFRRERRTALLVLTLASVAP